MRNTALLFGGFRTTMRSRRNEDGVMKISIDDIKTSPTEIHFVEDEQGLNQTLAQGRGAEYCVSAPLQVDMVYVRSGDDLWFNGTIAGALMGQCSRCLAEYTIPLARTFSVALSPQRTLDRELELSSDELSAGFYSEEKIDVSAIVQEEVILALPSQPLCKEDCCGLCAQCGTNLNIDSCTCRPAWQDPRLAALATLRFSSQK